jgi:NitT/TauT family transport system substrate-binding protein
LLGIFAAVAAACGGTTPQPTGSSTISCSALSASTPVKIVYTPGASAFAPLHIAQARGYFTNENLSVTLSPLTSSSDQVSILASGQADVGFGGFSAGYFNAVAQGFDVRAVGSEQQALTPETFPAGFYVRSDLLDSGTVKAAVDLKGRKMAISGPRGQAGEFYIGLILIQGKLTDNDVQWLNLPYADMDSAFKNKSIDGAYVAAPFNVTGVEKSGSAKKFGDLKAWATQTSSGVLMGKSLTKDNRQAGAAVMRALIRAAHDLQGDYLHNDTILQQLITTGGFTKAGLQGSTAWSFDKNLAWNTNTFRDMQNIFAGASLLTYTKQLSFSQLTDESLRSAAADCVNKK